MRSNQVGNLPHCGRLKRGQVVDLSYCGVSLRAEEIAGRRKWRVGADRLPMVAAPTQTEVCAT
jgi:hypothetical protein